MNDDFKHHLFADHNRSVECDFFNGEIKEGSASLELNVFDFVLPKQELLFTQWFHTDCIASYYNLETFSKKHWHFKGIYIYNC